MHASVMLHRGVAAQSEIRSRCLMHDCATGCISYVSSYSIAQLGGKPRLMYLIYNTQDLMQQALRPTREATCVKTTRGPARAA